MFLGIFLYLARANGHKSPWTKIPLVLLLMHGFVPASSQNPVRNAKQELFWLRNALVKNHVEPKVIDNNFSKDVFDKLMEEIDPEKLYFTQTEIKSLEPFRTSLDDEINGQSWVFVSTLKDRFIKGLVRSQHLMNSLLQPTLDLKTKEVFEAETAEWPKDEQALADKHRKWLKSEILDRLLELSERDSIPAPDFFKMNIGNAIEHVKVTNVRPVDRLLKNPATAESYLTTAFFETIARVFDPHSAYLSPDDLEDLVGELSTENYYFGFTLDEEGRGNIIIGALAPGGAAWKSGMLHVSDMLLSVKWLNEDAIDVRGMTVGDVSEMLDKNDENALELRIKTVEGSEKSVALRKEKLESDEDAVQSFIVDGTFKTGYIYLPDFYTRWNDEKEGGRSASDVAKEIIRLKNEGIRGLILDLRFNGGGSLYEAAAMAGIFIDEGPLGMMKRRDQKAVTIRDMNRGTVYDGPLLVMVNGNSASASEVLAGCIQDYNRGIIVGSQTYGKATGQDIYPLDPKVAMATRTNAAGRSTGYATITTEKLYRVSGRTAQGQGITPDVVLPDLFSALDFRESEYPFFLKPDSISRSAFFKPQRSFNRGALREKSTARVKNNLSFQQMEKTISWLSAELQKDGPPPILTWEEYSKQSAAEKSLENKPEAITLKQGSMLNVKNLAANAERFTVDDYAKAVNERWLAKLQSDIYLHESYLILCDYISLEKK
jgi:carboxyl-terminal processing protease